MDGLAEGIGGPLVAVRAIHFAATAMTVGALIFEAAVADFALRSSHAELAPTVVRSQTLRVAWIGLGVAIATGLLWLQLQTASMSGLPLSETMTSGVLSTVLNETQFGLVTKIRFVLAIALAVCLVFDRLALSRRSALGSALGFVAAIAWTGHAGSTIGEIGSLHLTADVLHLLAAATWIGGLVSLALLLTTARRNWSPAWASLARDVAQRFSTLGIISVGALLLTGIVNAWILVGSLNALIVSEYGRLLMLKIGFFAIMLVFAGINRLWLVPQLAVPSEGHGQVDFLRQLTRNSIVEIALGFAIFAIVGALGTLHPAIHGV